MATQLSQKDIKKIATLARLGLSEQEQTEMAEDVTRVLDHFSAIQAVDTKDTPTANDMSGLKNITREDVAEDNKLASADRLLELAPAVQGRHVKVQAVFGD